MYKNKRKLLLFVSAILFFVSTQTALAHSPNQSYIVLRIYEDSLSGRFEVAPEDLNKKFNLELKKNVTKEELAPHLKKIQDYYLEKVSFSTDDSNYKIKFTDFSILDGAAASNYVRINFDLEGVKGVPEKIVVDYRAFLSEIKDHRGMLAIEYDWREGIHGNEAIVALVFSPSNTKQELPTARTGSIFMGFIAMIKLGIWHIWIGIDHILFLLALLLPSVLYLRKRDESLPVEEEKAKWFWKPIEKFKPAFINVVKIVTSFTIAHTITLSLAALGIIELPSRFVESVIAISIALAALHNLRPLILEREWLIAFGFGLFHGFGFAGVLAEKGFAGEFMALTLLGFNLGVEIGQLVIICLIFPVLFFLRKTKLYPIILTLGSIFLTFVSIYWFIERAFEVDLPLGAIILKTLGIE